MSSVPTDPAKVQVIVDKMRREQRAADEAGFTDSRVATSVALGMIEFWAEDSYDSDDRVRDEICTVLAALRQYVAEATAGVR